MQILASDTIRSFWRTNRAMTLFFFSNFVFLGIGLVGMLVDPREVLGYSTWAKAVKFAISLLLYSGTMLWMFGYLNLNRRLKGLVLTSSAMILFVEMLLIVLQGARAVPMHFNVSTPFDATLWSVMGTLITVFYVINVLGFVLFLRQPFADRTLAWSIKAGLAIMLVGFGVAYLMTGPTNAQMAHMQSGAAPVMIGAHTVGAPDGGAGLPLLGWSTRYGDLRVAHFVGIHGPQVMALFGLALMLLARRADSVLRESHRLKLVAGAAVAYLGVVGLVTWQALREQPITSPDLVTVASFGLLALAFVGYAALVVGSAKRAAVETRVPLNASAA